MHFTPMPVKSADDIHHICLHNTIDFFLPRFCLKKIRGITITCVYSKITVQSVACYRSGDEVVVWYLHRNAIPGASILYLNGGKGKKEVGKWFFPSSVLLLTEWSSRLFRSSELLLSSWSCATKQSKKCCLLRQKEETKEGPQTDEINQIWGTPKHAWSSKMSLENNTQCVQCAPGGRGKGKAKWSLCSNLAIQLQNEGKGDQSEKRQFWKILISLV